MATNVVARAETITWKIQSGWAGNDIFQTMFLNWKASIESLETSCKLQNPGDRGQWIVLSLAHGKLANEKELSEQERQGHKTEAQRWYDLAIKQIDGHPGLTDEVGQAIRAFRAEAAERFDVKEKPK